ncbi:DUF4190 domain-containing protein [Streptomyces griseosporeus]|uniref:DUF4190 domain-containing protein n=1 Tax=Streptomyces griseosporeus TaxID=1910 RepID=UPI0036FA2A58
MSDDAPTPEPRDAVPPVSLGKADKSAEPQDAAPPVSLGKPEAPVEPAAGTDARDAAAGAQPQAPAPWAAPAAAAQQGPGHTVGAGLPSPAASTVHDQQTIAAMPGAPEGVDPATGATAQPNGTAGPFAPPASGTAQPAAPVNPFAPPGPAAQPGPQANPFAPPGNGTQANPFAPPAPGEPVPPPPIAPEGPGQVPYGYPAGGYGYPPQHGYGGAHSPQAQPVPGGYYGWPGMVPAPSNGIGTAGLVVGIVSAAIFCLWPVAIVLGILGIVFGAVGRSRANRGQATNAGQALAGIICGVAGLVLGIGMMVLVLAT